MVQLSILSGSQAGGLRTVRRFPFHVGRAEDNDLCLDGAGVWDYHFKIELQPGAGFNLETFDQAFAAVNDQPQKSAQLRNGDMISFGAVKMQFWLAPPVQRGLHLREMFVWALLLAITAFQAVLIGLLMRMG